MRRNKNKNIFGEYYTDRSDMTLVTKEELDRMKIEAFDHILSKSHEYYEVYDTVEGTEYDFDSQSFGEYVEDHIVHFNHIYSEEDTHETETHA